MKVSIIIVVSLFSKISAYVYYSPGSASVCNDPSAHSCSEVWVPGDLDTRAKLVEQFLTCGISVLTLLKMGVRDSLVCIIKKISRRGDGGGRGEKFVNEPSVLTA